MKSPMMLHFLCGSTGAGKTTYGRRLAEEIGGVFLSVDSWMSSLFWMDAPDPVDPAWAIERIERCRATIWQTAVDIARQGPPCLLEIGFTTQKVRAKYAALAAEAQLPVRLHFLDIPAEERWRRVEARNREETDQLGFAVTRAMFDYVEAIWEPPSTAEMAACDGTRLSC
jgi:predicted kinase